MYYFAPAIHVENNLQTFQGEIICIANLPLHWVAFLKKLFEVQMILISSLLYNPDTCFYLVDTSTWDQFCSVVQKQEGISIVEGYVF